MCATLSSKNSNIWNDAALGDMGHVTCRTWSDPSSRRTLSCSNSKFRLAGWEIINLTTRDQDIVFQFSYGFYNYKISNFFYINQNVCLIIISFVECKKILRLIPNFAKIWSDALGKVGSVASTILSVPNKSPMRQTTLLKLFEWIVSLIWACLLWMWWCTAWLIHWKSALFVIHWTPRGWQELSGLFPQWLQLRNSNVTNQ